MKAQRPMGRARRGASIRGAGGGRGLNEKARIWLHPHANSPRLLGDKMVWNCHRKKRFTQLRAVGWGQTGICISSDGLLQTSLVEMNRGSHGEVSGRRGQSLREQDARTLEDADGVAQKVLDGTSWPGAGDTMSKSSLP